MSYIQSLRFKIMILCVVPLLSAAFLFIAHSVIIAYQVKDAAAELYTEAVAGVEGAAALEAVENVSVDMGWIAGQWALVFIAMVILFYIPITINIRRLIAPIRKAAKYSDSLADGDVDVDVVHDRKDEIGVLQQSFQRLVQACKNQAELIAHMADGDLTGDYAPRSDADVVGHSLILMLQRNNEALMQVLVAAEQLSEAAAQTAERSQEMAEGSSQQSSSVEEISEAVGNIKQLSHENGKMAEKASTLASDMKSRAEKGNQQMEQMLGAVKDISKATQGIEKIIKVVEDIAFQTNILALNASVEAARAGQYGKGFAVVAEEVRSLANKSAEAASDTVKLITDSVQKTELGVHIADENAKNLATILSGIGESERLIHKIAESTIRQSTDITHINDSVSQVSLVIQQNTATSQELAAASEEISAQTTMLKESIGRFKLKANTGTRPSSRLRPSNADKPAVGRLPSSV